ncbi:DUF2147 domain-containing protein [Pseudooceanicola sp. 502str34]|uniref:DUF2147 domain-containing protein n=1 Tax=Maritimibacter alkaliphilus TaxID=404236 RepID=UPI001C9816DD|nr:DUF2147 domain-containing protein [Maritimibacter alkaliphilus]MBY6092759.1 DUF2147 domain-containing protein [Maritimibacter alkaliphilus]
MTYLKTALAALVLSTGAAMADPVEGMWQTQVDDGAYAIVKMAPCGGQICGTIARTFRSGGEYKSENIGRQLVWDMAAKGGGAYGDGKIWQPSTDKVYRSKMVLNGETLAVSGCFGPICKKQTWTRVK